MCRRRYLLLEFPSLAAAGRRQHVLEIGCGCGSSLLPVLKVNPDARVTATDLSPTAVRLFADAAARAGIAPDRYEAFPCDAADPAAAQQLAGLAPRNAPPEGFTASQETLRAAVLGAVLGAGFPRGGFPRGGFPEFAALFLACTPGLCTPTRHDSLGIPVSQAVCMETRGLEDKCELIPAGAGVGMPG